MFYIDTVSQNSLDSTSNASRLRSFTRQTLKNDSIGIGLRINFRKYYPPVHQSSRAGLEQSSAKHAHVILGAITRMRVISEFLGALELQRRLVPARSGASGNGVSLTSWKRSKHPSVSNRYISARRKKKYEKGAREPEIQFGFIVRISGRGSRRWNVSGAPSGRLRNRDVRVCVWVTGFSARPCAYARWRNSSRASGCKNSKAGQGRAGNETREKVAPNIFVIAPRWAFRQREMYFAVAPQPLCYHRLNSTGIFLKTVSTLHHCFAWIRLSQAKAFWHNFIRGTGAERRIDLLETWLAPPSTSSRENMCLLPGPLRL